MAKIEPISIIATIILLIGFLFGSVLGTLIMILGAILLSVSYKRFKNNPSYNAKWILYVGATILLLSILIRILGSFLVVLL